MSGKNTPSSRPRSRRSLAIAGVLLGGLALVGFGALVLGTPVAEQPTSCIACHDMTPYYEAWKVGPHAGGKATCVDCHVDEGVVNHWINSVVSLREVAGEFAGRGKYPQGTLVLPSARCARCHPAPKDTLTGKKFSHARHRDKVACSRCHIQTGHAVTNDALAAAGVLDAQRSAELTIAAMPNSQAWAQPGYRPMAAPHPRVVCWACHDTTKVGCTFCHSGNPHPSTSSNCAECHKPPAGHFASGCARCHRLGRPFNQPVFDHPPVSEAHTYQSFPCVKCHPNGFATVDCKTCHAQQGAGG